MEEEMYYDLQRLVDDLIGDMSWYFDEVDSITKEYENIPPCKAINGSIATIRKEYLEIRSLLKEYEKQNGIE